MQTWTRGLAVVVGGIAPVAFGQTVDVAAPLQGPGKVLRVTTPGGTANLFAGQLTHTLSNAAGGESWLNGPRVSFTLLPTAAMGPGVLEYGVSSISALSFADPHAGAKADAIQQYFNNAQHLATDPASSPDFAACIQLLIWETMYDYDPGVGSSSLSLTSGSFTAAKSTGLPLSSAFLGIFNSFVGGLNTLPDAGFRVTALDHAAAADYLAVRQIPAPGLAGAVVLAGLAAGRRRR